LHDSPHAPRPSDHIKPQQQSSANRIRPHQQTTAAAQSPPPTHCALARALEPPILDRKHDPQREEARLAPGQPRKVLRDPGLGPREPAGPRQRVRGQHAAVAVGKGGRVRGAEGGDRVGGQGRHIAGLVLVLGCDGAEARCVDARCSMLMLDADARCVMLMLDV
jgi:hypothetical protein